MLLLELLLLLMELGGWVERGEGRNGTQLMGRRRRMVLLLLMLLLLLLLAGLESRDEIREGGLNRGDLRFEGFDPSGELGRGKGGKDGGREGGGGEGSRRSASLGNRLNVQRVLVRSN